MRLGELDGVADDRVVGRAAQVEELVQPEAQRGQHRRVEARGRALGELLDQVVERALALHGAVGESHRKRAVARIERPRLGLQRLVGVGAVLEHPAQHGVGAAARGRRDRGGGGLGIAGMIGYPLRLDASGARTVGEVAGQPLRLCSPSVAVVMRIAGRSPASR